MNKKQQVKAIQRKVAREHGLTLKQLLSESREKHIADARHVAMFIARRLTGMSYPRLGSEFKRCHSTVMDAHSRIGKLCDDDANFRKGIVSIMTDLEDLIEPREAPFEVFDASKYSLEDQQRYVRSALMEQCFSHGVLSLTISPS